MTLQKPLVYRTKSQLAYEAIRESIVGGVLKPGERIAVNHLAEELGMSEIPVREAVKQLEAEGLISRNGSGFMITKLTAEELEENYVIRSALEVLAAKTAVQGITEETIEELEEIISQMSDCLREGQYLEYGRLNQQYHLSIYAQSPYHRLYSMIKDLWGHAQRTRVIFTLRKETSRDSHEEHIKILQAIKSRSELKVEEVMRAHTERTLKVLRSILKEEEEKGAGE